MPQLKNCYVRRAKISEKDFKYILMLFELDLTAKKIASLIGLNRNTINRYLTRLRVGIKDYQESVNPLSTIDKEKIINHYTEKTLFKDTILAFVEDKNQIYSKVIHQSNNYNVKLMLFMQLTITAQGVSAYGFGKLPDLKADRTKDFIIYFIQRIIKFRGISKKTFLLHLRESELRFNSNNNFCSCLESYLKVNPI